MELENEVIFLNVGNSSSKKKTLQFFGIFLVFHRFPWIPFFDTANSRQVAVAVVDHVDRVVDHVDHLWDVVVLVDPEAISDRKMGGLFWGDGLYLEDPPS